MHAYNTSVHIQCEAVYNNTGVRDVNFMLSKVQMFEMYTYSYSFGQKYDECVSMVMDQWNVCVCVCVC